MALEFEVNGRAVSVTVDPDTPLLWVLRENLGLTGTKFGCGAAQCGACTVHVNGKAARSCVMPVSAAVKQQITTIEGLANDPKKQALIQAWIEEEVPQCGYCQTGQIMSAAALLAEKHTLTDRDIDDGMAGNICRCATYVRIRKAIHRAAELAQGGK